jgi:Isoprenylcysteine carboxyl methyltransferase (ICMT) family
LDRHGQEGKTISILSRDIRGRIAGVFLYVVFLTFHLGYVHKGWNFYSPAAKANSVLITATIVFFLASYFLRRKPILFPHGFKETVFPLVCASLPLIIYHSIELQRLVPAQNAASEIFQTLFGIHNNGLLGWNLFSMILVLTGNCITLLGIISLRRSFSIMVEAREPVFTGLYAYVRHPLYIGEALAASGVLVFRFSLANIFFYMLFIVFQVYRAALEEKKIVSVFPEYKEYRKKTGALFPRSLRPDSYQTPRKHA